MYRWTPRQNKAGDISGLIWAPAQAIYLSWELDTELPGISSVFDIAIIKPERNEQRS